MKKFISIILIIFSFMLVLPNVYASTTYRQGLVHTASTIYSSPGSNQIKSDVGRAIYLYYPEAVEILGESGNYYQIRFLYNGFFYTGYIHKNNIYANTYTTDDNYENSLRNAGFPQEYAHKLAILHAIHPNWTFTPSMTGGVSSGMDFYTAVNAEGSNVKRNLISSGNTTLRSTADGAYSNGKWTEYEGGGWYAASKQTIAYYMDPRNFLDESHIFMFENLAYDSNTQSRDTVNKILSSTYMANAFYCYSGANYCSEGYHNYLDSFMSAGTDKKVSPVHLSSRVVQEQGSSGSTLTLGNGYNGEYKGYYNFYNIGATGTTSANVILNGLKFAYNHGWNNQHYAIYDGAGFLASNYIYANQNTRYYQKFNTVSLNYDHQYMQNIQAPYTEAYSTYTAYYKSYGSQSAWNSAGWNFIIPVYSNMGGSTSLDVNKNDDATLSSLSISGCNMNPSFQSSAYYYDCYVPTSTSSVNITAYATNALAKVNNPGSVRLDTNDKTIDIVVTAASGSTATYKVNVHKIETDGYSPSDILNGIGMKVNGDITYNIALGTDVSNIISGVQNSYRFASVSSNISGSARTGAQLYLTNAGASKTFVMVIYGDTIGDGNISMKDLLVIKKHLVGASTLSGAYLTAADINRDGVIDVKDLLLEKKYLVGQYTINQG